MVDNILRYGSLYVEWMQNLPDDLHKAFMKYHSVAHSKEDLFNDIWTDQFIECTWMRFGSGPGGLTGIVTDPKQRKIWAQSSAAITSLSSSIANMEDAPKNKATLIKKVYCSLFLRRRQDCADTDDQ